MFLFPLLLEWELFYKKSHKIKYKFQSQKAYKKFYFEFISNFTKYKKYFKNFSDFCGKIFSILLIVYPILLLIEQFFKNPFKQFFNLNVILIMLIVSGSFYVISINEKEIEQQEYEIKRKDILFIFLLGIIGSVLIWIRTKEYGPISYYISIVSGFFMIIPLYYVLKRE